MESEKNDNMVASELSDVTAVSQFSARDTSSLSELYEAYATSLYSLAIHIVDDQRAAENVVERVFRQVDTDATRYGASLPSVGNWLLLETRRLAIGHMRSQHGEDQEPDTATVQLPDPACRQQFVIRSTDEADLLRNALATLPQLDRLAVEMAYFEGLSSSQIAERLEQPAHVIQERVQVALTVLRDKLETRK